MKQYLALSVVALGLACSSAKDTQTAGNGAPVSKANQEATNTGPGRPGTARDRKNRPNADPSATPHPPEFRPAPEDSEAAVTMDEDGAIHEIRVFKNHPELERVEFIWTDPKDKRVLFTLKGGRKVETRTDTISNLQAASAAELMSLANKSKAEKKADRPRLVNSK